MELLPIYITTETIMRLQISGGFGDLHSIENARDAFEMIEFLKYGSYVHIEKDKKDINLSELFKSNPLLAHLIVGGNGKKRIEFTPDEHQIIENKGLTGINTHHSCQFFTTSLTDEESRKLEVASGMLHHSLKTSYRSLSRIFRTHVEYFRRNRMASLDMIFEKILPHHSIVILDPYLLHGDYEHLTKFLLMVKPRGIETYHVTLVLSSKKLNDDGQDPKEWITTKLKFLKKDLLSKSGKTKIVLEHLVVNNNEFHDRMIITNNQVIFQGYGMNTYNKWEIAKKLTTWVFIPHTKMESRMNGMISCHFKNILEISNAINQWRMNAEDYSSHELKNPILKQYQRETKGLGFHSRGISLDELYQKMERKV
jgi:hypothetical protein